MWDGVTVKVCGTPAHSARTSTAPGGIPPGTSLSKNKWYDSCRGFKRTAFTNLRFFQLSQSEALQSVTAFQSFNLKGCFVTITNLI